MGDSLDYMASPDSELQDPTSAMCALDSQPTRCPQPDLLWRGYVRRVMMIHCIVHSDGTRFEQSELRGVEHLVLESESD